MSANLFKSFVTVASKRAPTQRPKAGIREQRRLETRNRLYEAAVAEFQRVGFANAQIDRIVEAAGVARGTFYFHFPAKENVLLELQRRIETSVMERLARHGTVPTSVKDFLTRIIDAILEESESIGDQDLLREILSLYLRQPVKLNYEEEPLIGGLSRVFQQGVENGDVRDDIPTEEITIIFLVTLFGFFKGTTKAPRPERKTLPNMIEVFLHGITPKN